MPEGANSVEWPVEQTRAAEAAARIFWPLGEHAPGEAAAADQGADLAALGRAGPLRAAELRAALRGAARRPQRNAHHPRRRAPGRARPAGRGRAGRARLDQLRNAPAMPLDPEARRVIGADPRDRPPAAAHPVPGGGARGLRQLAHRAATRAAGGGGGRGPVLPQPRRAGPPAALPRRRHGGGRRASLPAVHAWRRLGARRHRKPRPGVPRAGELRPVLRRFGRLPLGAGAQIPGRGGGQRRRAPLRRIRGGAAPHRPEAHRGGRRQRRRQPRRGAGPDGARRHGPRARLPVAALPVGGPRRHAGGAPALHRRLPARHRHHALVHRPLPRRAAAGARLARLAAARRRASPARRRPTS